MDFIRSTVEAVARSLTIRFAENFARYLSRLIWGGFSRVMCAYCGLVEHGQTVSSTM